MTTKQLLASNSYIQFPRFLGNYIGVNEAVLVSALCDKDSWCEFNIVEYDGWFYYLRDEIELETGLTESQQRTALKSLSDIKIISTKRAGIPSKMYYKINADVLETVLFDAYNAYNQRKIQLSQNMTTSGTKTMTTSGIENRITSIDNNINTKINKKAPAEPTLSSTKSRKRDLISRSKTTLVDDLESGKDIAEQKKAKKKSPKELFRDECLEIIEHEYSDSSADLLTDYFNFVSDVKQADSDNKMKVVKTVSAWRKKLDKLEELVKEGYDCEKLIKQSLRNKKYVFYPLESVDKNSQYNNQSNKFETCDVIPTQMTHEEILAEKQRLIDAGAKIY